LTFLSHIAAELTESMQIHRRPNPVVNVLSLRYQINTPEHQPRNILEKIVWHKESEVEAMRDRTPLVELQKQVQQAPAIRSFVEALRQSTHQPALIAEVKKASPSKGVIREDFDPVAIAQSYQEGGAACISVLTDQEFFQGSFDYLSQIRQTVDCPLLCKDFILYPYQIYKARTCGADAVLLIAAILPDKDIQYFLKILRALNMTALVEVHDLEELDRVLALDGVELIGINNRNLQDFSVTLQTTCDLLQARGAQLAEREILVVSESGLHHAQDLATVRQAGAQAVLIGESIVKQTDPKAAIASLFKP
jgi:indole-3-glycerol phosphate synthase